MPDDIDDLRHQMDLRQYASEAGVIEDLRAFASIDTGARATIAGHGADLVRQIRSASDPGLMEVFLAEYGLSTDEGVALMCLAEALLRVPDAETIDALIEDKIAPSDWGRHLGHSASSLVNASTWALVLTGRVLDDERPGVVGVLRGAVKRLGEPVIRTAVARAMKEMGRQFVLGETIGRAMDRARGMQAKGFTYSYDMLGEAARTEADARAYHLSYSRAISAIAEHCTHASVAENPGISVKLSALHPRYEEAQRDRVMAELMPRLRSLAILAKSAGMGLNVDAEEADRLQLSLDVIEAALSSPELAGWDGFGVVVQAYGHRAGQVIDWLHGLATRLDRRIMVRLVKGAYWDSEIKRAQVEGIDGFPVFTDKAATDISYIANARRLLGLTDRIYPQFATHNAHTVAAILHIAREMGQGPEQFEFQRLHGMGEVLHTLVMAENGTRCRIYAPVGAHKDLLAYLVRRLLENGANSSFVHQIVDEDVPPEEVASDPFSADLALDRIARAPDLFGASRRNSVGFDLTHRPTLQAIEAARGPFLDRLWQAGPVVDAPIDAENSPKDICNPARPEEVVGQVSVARADHVEAAFSGAANWDVPVAERAAILRQASELYEVHFGEVIALLAREAGKGLPDGVGELREAVDFLRYYAAEAEAGGDVAARGTWVCISPWNFPLAIFTGQIAAALATGNAVIAKPAEQTPLIASLAVSIMHEAGVPRTALQLLPGDGSVGAALTSDPRAAGVAFTGSTETARKIATAMAEHCAPGTPLIAETGGLNAMVVDSTALPEHAVRDIVKAAFRSAGQRCSALRCLYLQEDVADGFLTMLKGAMDELAIGDPWALSTDVGPVIDAEARAGIDAHVARAMSQGRVLHRLQVPSDGIFVAPTVIEIGGIGDLGEEIFGPVLHVARFRAEELDRVIDDINGMGYGLTFGVHTRIDDRVQHLVDRVEAGNIYVNRDQIGAVVGSQPFGGEGLSGTGPKAGGPQYLVRFAAPKAAGMAAGWAADTALWDPQPGLNALAAERRPRLAAVELPGPTGESNRLGHVARPPVLCLGPGTDAAQAQAEAIRALGGTALAAEGPVSDDVLTQLENVSAVLWWGEATEARAVARALSCRDGPLVPLVTAGPDAAHASLERHVCIDTTAAGGNAQLLAEIAN